MKKHPKLYSLLLALALAALLLLLNGGLDSLLPQESAVQTQSVESAPQAAPAGDAGQSGSAADIPQPAAPDDSAAVPDTAAPDEDGTYTTAEDVCAYLLAYGRLPGNFITKKQAQALGWSGGSLEPYAPGKCIGGDRFGNREGLLPAASGRTWTECDINTLGASSRGAERLVFSSDGLIYYTGDHYESFRLLAGSP